MKKFLLTHLVILGLISFGQTSNINEGCAPLEVKFAAPSNSTSYFWDFKDGVTSDKQNPVNIFTKTGTYDVEFREAVGGPVVNKLKITIYASPLLDITAPLGCAPYNVPFQNASVVDAKIPVSNYVWVFGDGLSYQGLTPPTHLYPNVGKFDVSLSIQSPLTTCNKTVIFSKKVEVLEPPVVSFSLNPNISCADSVNVSFNNTSTGKKPLKYSWVFANGSTSTDQNPASQKYKKGQYSPSLTVSYENITGCTASIWSSISVGRPNPKIVFGRDSVCPESPVKISSSIPGVFTWNFGSDASPSTSSNNTEMVSFAKQGIHIVSLKVTSYDGQCFGSVTDTIVVHDSITAKITPIPLFDCARPLSIPFKALSNQTNVKYKWEFLHHEKDSVQNVTKKYTRPRDRNKYDINKQDSIYAHLIVISNKSKCVAKDSILDIFPLPTSRIIADKWRGCSPLEVEFGNISEASPLNPIVSWKWIFGDGGSVINNIQDPVKHTFTKPGVYNAKLEVTTQRGCKDTSYTIRIEVGDKIGSQVDFTVDKTSICQGDPVTFTVTKTSDSVDAYHFYAEENRAFHCSDISKLKWDYKYMSGDEDVSLQVDYNGCFSTVTKSNMVTVKNATARIDYTAICAKPYEYTFLSKSVNATSQTWDFGDLSPSSTDASVTHLYDTVGNYRVILSAQNANGCAASLDTATINVRKIKAAINYKDTLLCTLVDYAFDGSSSKDVFADCHTGYTWQFPTIKTKRPYTSSSSQGSFSFNEDENGHNHIVRLIVKDINGCTDTATAKINIYDIKIKGKSDLTSICLPDTVSFTDLSTGDTTLTSWEWDFDDSTKSSSRNIIHPYLKSIDNIYDVKLTVKDQLGCHKSIPLPIQIYKPLTSIVIQDSTLCLGDTALISAPDFTGGGSGLSYVWDFGNGKKGDKPTNKVFYDVAKAYKIKLFYQQIGSACADSAEARINFQSKPHANFVTDVDTLKILCAPQNVTFNDASTGDFTFGNYWNFGNNQYSANNKYTLFYDKGVFNVFHEVSTSYGCKDDTSRTFEVFRPEGHFEMDKSSICKGEEINFKLLDTSDVSSYTWAFGDGDTLTNKAPVKHQYNFHPPTGQTLARLILRGFHDACTVESQLPVNIHQIISDFRREDGVDTSICFNAPFYHFTNTSSGIDTYKWDFGDGKTSSSDKDPVHEYAAPGAYEVKLTVRNNSLGCTDTIVKKALVTLNPTIDAIGDTVCQGAKLSMYVLNPRLDSKYKWSPNADLNEDSVSKVISSVLHTTVYHVTELDSNNCAGETDVKAQVVEPLGLADWDTTIVIGDQIALPAHKTELEIFKWSPEQGLSCINCSYPLIRPLKDTTYYLNVTDVMGCFSNDVTYKIKVIPETFVKMPTAFTPNNDGSNDIVNVRGWGIKDLLEFKVFNRWGQLLYSSNNIQEGWDGKFNGNLQNSDVYVYKVKVKTWTDKEISQERYINLIH
jgi:gliding motility-associated-like protein